MCAFRTVSNNYYRLCTERCEWKDDQFTNELYSLWGKQYHNLSSSRKPFNPFVDFLLAVMGFIHTIPSNRTSQI
jgi:hypothetical protein